MKKRLLFVLLLLMKVSMNVVADNRDKTEPNVERYNVTTDEGVLAFGKSYYEVDGRPVGANGNFYDADHGNWSMKGWPNNDVNRHVATYLHFPACSSNARIELNATGAVRFKLIVTCMQDGTVLDERTFSITQAGSGWTFFLQRSFRRVPGINSILSVLIPPSM